MTTFPVWTQIARPADREDRGVESVAAVSTTNTYFRWRSSSPRRSVCRDDRLLTIQGVVGSVAAGLEQRSGDVVGELAETSVRRRSRRRPAAVLACGLSRAFHPTGGLPSSARGLATPGSAPPVQRDGVDRPGTRPGSPYSGVVDLEVRALYPFLNIPCRSSAAACRSSFAYCRSLLARCRLR